MNDLNLIPQHIKIEQEKKSRKRINILLTVIILFVIIGITLLPIYLTYELSKDNAQVVQEISQFSSVSEEINKLNAQKKDVQDRTKVLESLSKQENKWTGIINDISSLIPPPVTLISINGSGDNISLQCTSLSRDDIALFMAKLENSDKFTDIKINEIRTDEKTQKYLFGLQIKPKNTESKVK